MVLPLWIIPPLPVGSVVNAPAARSLSARRDTFCTMSETV